MARACPLCGAETVRVVFGADKVSSVAESYRVVKCAACQLRYTDPVPPAEDLAALYGEEFYGNTAPRLLSWDALRLLLHRSVLWQRRRALAGRRPGRALDLGCGDGDFLASLARRGWEVYGTEFSTAASALAQAKGVTTHQGDLASAAFPDGFFDVVTLWHVLEHLPDPVAELAEVRRVLRDDGLLVIEVPNSACLTFQLCKERWFPLNVPRHLQHFTPETLGRLLRRTGFDPGHRRNFRHSDAVLAFVSLVNRLNLLGRLGGEYYFVGELRSSSWLTKAVFALLGVPLVLFSVPYSIITTFLNGNGELVTVSARKVAL